MWARYWAYIVLTSALIYVYFNGIGLPFQQMFLVIPPKPTVIHQLSIKIYTKNFYSPLYAHILEFPSPRMSSSNSFIRYDFAFRLLHFPRCISFCISMPI